MEPTDVLLTIVEIAVALAGFASLVTVIGRRDDDSKRKQDTLRLRLMLEVTLRIAALALVALPFVQQAPGPVTWRLLSGLHLVTTAIHAAHIMRSIRGKDQQPSPKGLSLPVSTLTALAVAASTVNVVGYAPLGSFAMFLAALVSGLMVAGMLFVSVASSVLRDDPGEGAA
jgi:hypothetical protein